MGLRRSVHAEATTGQVFQGTGGASERGDPVDGADRGTGCNALVLSVDGVRSGYHAHLRAPGVAVERVEVALGAYLQVSTDPHFEEKLQDVIVPEPAGVCAGFQL